MSGVPAGSAYVTVTDPLFLDADGGDLHLPATSPAVDYCDESLYPFPGGPDFDGDVRGADHPTNPNGTPGPGNGRFDIGFDEVSPSAIFSDGFESGDWLGWSAALP